MINRRAIASKSCLFLVVLATALAVGCTVDQAAMKPPSAGLPTQRDFPAQTRLTLYPPGPLAQPVVIRGEGAWTLRFEPTGDPRVASVRLVDARIRLDPFTVDYDTDGDGRLETVRVTAIELGRNDFDLEASRGTLNRETGEFSMTVAHVLTRDAVPILGQLGIPSLRFRYTERGYMDLARGTFTTYAPIFALPAPLETTQVGAGENPCCPAKPALIVLPRFICEKQCVAGGNVVEFYATVQHFQQGQACQPSKFTADLRNNTEKQKLVPTQGKWTSSPTGVFQLKGVTDTVDTDLAKTTLPKDPKTTYEMTAFVPDCDPAVSIKQVTVISTPKRFYLCTASADEHGPASGSWTASLSERPNGAPLASAAFGKGLIVGEIDNPSTNPYAVQIKYGGAVDVLSPGGAPSKAFAGMPPGYAWDLQIPMRTPDFQKYQSELKDSCLEVTLRCECKPG